MASVCAVVVTFNRKRSLYIVLSKLLESRRCIDRVLVVDNHSTDGSYEYIKESGVLKNGYIEWIRLNDNQGGAGGFQIGIQYALENGFKYIWLMDDDGFPLGSCIDELLENATESQVIGPVVINQPEIEGSLLSFNLRLPGTQKVIESYAEFKTLFPYSCEGVLFPFNGTFLPSKIVRKIGLPKSEYFIWGDETEYLYRIKKNGYKVKTFSNAFFYHPKSESAGVPMFFGLMKYNEPGSDLKRYCFVRNSLKNFYEYKSTFAALLFISKVIWFNLFTEPNFSRLKLAVFAIYDCCRGDFSKHKRYIKNK